MLYGEVENLDESSFTSLLKTVTNQKPTKVRPTELILSVSKDLNLRSMTRDQSPVLEPETNFVLGFFA